jgi:dipeptidyl aminopeptidase/acylaminoacyl peptidase
MVRRAAAVSAFLRHAACVGVVLAGVGAVPAVAGAAERAGLATGAENGAILARTRCDAPSDSYREYLTRAALQYREDAEAARRAGLTIRPEAELGNAVLPEPDWRGRRAYRDYVCERLLYASDGLAVVAYLWRPARVEGRSLPLIVFNHGGRGESGKLRPNTQFGFWRFVQTDYVVLGTQYRGIDGSEGRESVADGDVRDVLNLFPVAAQLGFVNTNNAFMLGYSRGGLVTALALKAGAPVNAAATVSGLFDVATLAGQRAEVADIATAALPGMPPAVAAKTLSAVEWPDQLRVPMLLLAGSADGTLDPATHTIALARALQSKGRPYSLVVYDGDTHGLTFSGADRDARILEWFARHRK